MFYQIASRLARRHLRLIRGTIDLKSDRRISRKSERFFAAIVVLMALITN